MPQLSCISHRRSGPRRAAYAALALAAALTLAACGDKGKGGAAGPGGAPAPVVGVVEVQLKPVPMMTELPGRLEPNRTAQVRARTAGVVQKRLFREGGDVREGQSLFQIDNAPQMASLQSARASLAKAEASLGQTSMLAQRYKPLMAANAISKQEYDNAVAAERASRAEVLAAQAAVRTAQINVGYSQVLAPISGRIGKAQVTEGALVGQGEATLLATIQQLNPMVVNFTQSASDLMRLRQSVASGQASATSGNPEVQVVLEDGTPYPLPGRLLFTDTTVDPATGQVTLKAEIPNPQGVLLPGLFVRTQVEQARIDNAVLIPQQAVTRGTAGDSVQVVNADGSFAARPIKIAQAQGNQWVVTDGLRNGDKVIVEGMSAVQMTRAQKVTPQPWQPGGAKPAASVAQAASGASAAAPAAAAPASAASR